MNKIINNMVYVLKSAWHWKVLAWFLAFFVLFAVALVLPQPIFNLSPSVLKGCSYAWLVLYLFLLINLKGFLFLSSVGAKEKKEKPLSVFLSRETFIQGLNVIFTLLVTSIPLFMLWEAVEFLHFYDFYPIFEVLSLLYIVFGLLPAYMQMVQEYPNYSIKNSLWKFFRKNASSVFACVFWFGFLLSVWASLADFILGKEQIYSKTIMNLSSKITIDLSTYLFVIFLLFYVYVVGFLVVGILARPKAVLITEGNMKKPVVEEKTAPVIKKVSKRETKKLPQRKKAKRK